jgi:GGDEF domain-containing protein
MLLFRIGGDEFAVVTGYGALADAEALARRVADKNGESLTFESREIPIHLRIGICQIPTGGLSYQRALNILAESVALTRKDKGLVAIYNGD